MRPLPLKGIGLVSGSTVEREFATFSFSSRPGYTDADTRLTSIREGQDADGFGHCSIDGQASLPEYAHALLKFMSFPGIPAGFTVTDVRVKLVYSRNLGVQFGFPGMYIEFNRVLQSWRAAQESLGFGTRATWANRGVITPPDPPSAWNTPGLLSNTDCLATPSSSVLLPTGGVVGTEFTFTGAGFAADVQTWLDDSNSRNGWRIKVPTDRFTHEQYIGFAAEEATADLEPDLGVNAPNCRPLIEIDGLLPA
jgi:hypothetical protein